LSAITLKAAKTSIFLETYVPLAGIIKNLRQINMTPEEAGNYELDAVTRYELEQIGIQRKQRLKELRESPVGDLCSILQADDALIFDMYLTDTDKYYLKDRYRKKVLTHFESCKSCSDAYSEYHNSMPACVINRVIGDWVHNALKAWRAQLKYNCPN
jgi:hypothetical protein